MLLRQAFLVLVCICYFFSGCERDRRGDPIELFVKNFSLDTVYFITQFNYPDTSLIDYKMATSEIRGTKVLPHSTGVFLSLTGWERDIKMRNAEETLIVIVYSLDTMQLYPFEQIQSEYNILRRYDLTIEQLRALEWTVSYP